MLLGKPSSRWSCSFEIIDEYILELINNVWPSCLDHVDSRSKEDDISAELIYQLHYSPEARSTPFNVRGQTELYGKKKLRRYIKGRHDIEFFIRDKAIVYECKLTKPKKVKRRTNTTLVDRYVLEGLNRFLSGQYAERDPFGGMFAYVVDGDVSNVMEQLNSCIADHTLTNAESSSLPSIGAFLRFSSSHRRENPCPSITIHHALLPMRPPHELATSSSMK